MPASPDPLTNPYAPPASVGAPSNEAGEPRTRRRSRYEAERRSVPLLVLLSIVTLGVYGPIWYLRRARFLESLDCDRKVGVWPWVSVVLTALLFVAAVARGPEGLVRMLQLASGLVTLLLAFRVAGILRSDFARTGRPIGIASVGVFFFGCLYLQHVINEAADTPARAARRRKKERSADEADAGA